MASLEEIVVQLTAETSQLRSEMANASKIVAKSTEEMNKSISAFSKDSTKETSVFKNSLSTMVGVVGGNLVTSAFNTLKDVAGATFELFKEGVADAAEVQSAMVTLSNSLAATGQYSSTAAKQLEDFTDEMEVLTGISQGDLIKNLSALSGMTGLNAQNLQNLQKAAIDASAVLGKDFTTVSTALAKAVNGNTDGLQKLGIQFKDTGDSAKNAAGIVEMFNTRFGGAAESQLKTYAGSLRAAKVEFGNIFEEIGKVGANNTVAVTSFSSFSQVFAEIKESIGANLPAITAGANALIAVGAVIGAAITGLISIVIDLGRVFKNIAELIVGTVIGVFGKVYEVLTGDVIGAFDETKSQWEDLKNSFSGNWADSTTGALLNIAVEASNGTETYKDLGKEAVIANNEAGKAVNYHKEQLTSAQEALKSWAASLASNNEAISSGYAFANQVLVENNAQKMAILGEDYAAQLTAQQEFFNLQQEMRDSQYVSEQDQLAQARASGLVTEEQYQAAKLALAQKYALDNAKQQTAITQFNAQQEKTRADNFKGTMSTIASLSSSGNKELAAIGKAAAITNATIDGYAAVQKALASAPPPFNFALAGLVGAATAANVAKIAGVGLAGGIDSVPSSASGGNNGDNFPAVLKAGERVVPSETNQDLKEFLAKQQGGGQVNINVTVMPNTGLNGEQIGNLIEQLNSYFSSGGLKLLGAI